MIAFTCDIDWAPDEVVADTISLFEEFQVKCTLFATHDSAILRSLNSELFEIAIHPNFNLALQGKGSIRSVLDDILELYPSAKGVRSHSMFQSSVLLNIFKEVGLVYEANHFLPYHQNIKPFVLWNGLVRIPYVWEDDIHFTYELPFSDSRIDVRKPGLKVFAFHPVHVFINTENVGRYERAKPHYQNPKALREHRNTGVPGARDLLIRLLEENHKLSDENQSLKLEELAGQVVASGDSANPWLI